MNVIAELTVTSLRDLGDAPLSGYEAKLTSVCDEHPPAFGAGWYGDRFRKMCLDRHWFIDSLASNTAKEAEGARRIWEMASRTGDPGVVEHLRQHAIDEARHARYYIAMIGLAFPSLVKEETRADLLKFVPEYTEKSHPVRSDIVTPPEAILDELIQMNVGEIRTRVHQLLLRPVITAYCPPENRTRLTKLLDSLLLDETRHVAYTAKLIDRAVADGEGDWVTDIMRLRWPQFNGITMTEMESNTFDAG